MRNGFVGRFGEIQSTKTSQEQPMPHRAIRGLKLGLLLSTLLFLDLPFASPQTQSTPASALFVRVHSSVVVIFAMDNQGGRKVQGSGFIVDRNKVATNHHVVETMTEAYVIFSDGDIKAVTGVVADSSELDLTVLAVNTGGRPGLVMGDELTLRQGDTVYALGAPQGLELSLTNGIVSSFRKANGQFLIQTTAAISHGSSGGPLFDGAGRVVGVTTSMISNSPGIYFSIGIGDLKRLLRTPELVVLPFEEWSKEQSRAPRALDRDEKPVEDISATQIEDLLQKKLFDQAKSALLTYSAANPGSPVVHRLNGELSLRTGEPDIALRELDLAVKGNPNDALAHFYYAIGLLILHRYQEAVAHEEASNRLAPTAADQSLLAVLYYATGDFAKAEAAARTSVSTDPNNKDAHDVLAGLAYHGLSSRKEDWIQSLQALSQIDPNDFWIQVSRGNTVYGTNPKASIAYYQVAEKDDFPDATPFERAAQLYIQVSEFGQANDQVKVGLSRVPGDMQLLSEGMFVSLLERDHAEAGRRFDELQRVYPQSGSAHFAGCLYYYGIGQAATSLPYCARYVAQFPTNHTGHSNYGWAALDANQFVLAFQQFSKAYEIVTPQWNTLGNVQVIDLMWGFTLSAYFSGDKKYARKLLQEIRKDLPSAATVTGLQAMPLLWSTTTMQRIEGLLIEYPK
jgi:tetratricopeptide (TPR) repeat protein